MQFRSDIPNGHQCDADTAGRATDLAKNTLGSSGGGVERRSLAEEKKHSVREASKLAGISESALRLEINKGRIPILKIASKIQILASDLEHFLRGHYGAVPQAVETIRISSRLPKHFADSDLINPKRKSA